MMDGKSLILDNGELKVSLLLPDCYSRSRYDHSGMVEQVSLGENTFLSRERIGGGTGLGGVGLAFCFEWADTSLYDAAGIADVFPQLGVGLLKRTDNAPFQFNRDYPVTEFEHIVDVGESCAEVHTLPHLSFGAAADQIRRWSLDRRTLTVSSVLRNVGERDIEATEFCHNFFQFNDMPIDGSYRLSFPYTILPKMRRGCLTVGRDFLSPFAFDGPTESTAFWINGYEGLKSHWMKLENSVTGTGVLVEDDFELCKIYGWSNRDALCPETFIRLSLKSGESIEWKRKYTFYTL